METFSPVLNAGVKISGSHGEDLQPPVLQTAQAVILVCRFHTCTDDVITALIKADRAPLRKLDRLWKWKRTSEPLSFGQPTFPHGHKHISLETKVQSIKKYYQIHRVKHSVLPVQP